MRWRAEGEERKGGDTASEENEGMGGDPSHAEPAGAGGRDEATDEAR